MYKIFRKVYLQTQCTYLQKLPSFAKQTNKQRTLPNFHNF